MSKLINMAIILAAGQGRRLRPLTESTPKSLIRIGGASIIEHLLQSLSSLGIEYVVVVVGYLGDSIRREIGSSYQGMQINYVENSLYECTESLMSLWQAREFFYSDLLLVEGDLLLDPGIVSDVITCPHKNAMAVAGPEPVYRSGIFVSIGDRGLINNMIVCRDKQKDLDFEYMYRTLNIYKFSSEFLRNQLKPRLKLYLNLGLTRDCYQILMRDFIAEGIVSFVPVLTGRHRWLDIDTTEDLDTANQMFSNKSEFCPSMG